MRAQVRDSEYERIALEFGAGAATSAAVIGLALALIDSMEPGWARVGAAIQVGAGVLVYAPLTTGLVVWGVGEANGMDGSLGTTMLFSALGSISGFLSGGAVAVKTNGYLGLGMFVLMVPAFAVIGYEASAKPRREQAMTMYPMATVGPQTAWVGVCLRY